MGLARRVIPVLTHKGDTLIKDRKFAGARSIGSVVQAAKIYGSRGADEIALLDIAAQWQDGPNLAVVERVSNDLYTPLAAGGGVRTVQHVRDLLMAGADKVIINTAAINTTLIRECADKFGSQAIVASIDFKLVRDRMLTQVHSHGGTVNALWNPHALAVLYAQHGAGEIMLTDIDREGMMQGFELDYLRLIAGIVACPVIAHAGCGTPAHALEAIQAGASAVGIGSMFAFTDETPATTARYLHERGVEVRLP